MLRCSCAANSTSSDPTPAHRELRGLPATPLCSLVQHLLRHNPPGCVAAAPTWQQHLKHRSIRYDVNRTGARASKPARCAAQAGAIDGPQDEDACGALTRALLLAWFASQNQSLLAAKCVVETVLQIYRQGLTFDDVQLSLSLANLSSGGTLLEPIDQDLLAAWAALILLTLEQAGVPRGGGGDGGLATGEVTGDSTTTDDSVVSDNSAMNEGLRMFVRGVVGRWLGGLSLARLSATQSVANAADGASPAVRVMQQNTRLIIITLEVIRENRIDASLALEQALPPASDDAEIALSSDSSSDESYDGPDDDGQDTPAAAADLRIAASAPGVAATPDGGQSGAAAGGDAADEGDAGEHPDAAEQDAIAAALRGVVSRLDYVAAFVPGACSSSGAGGVGGSDADGGGGDGGQRLRPTAVRLLVAFMGAALRSLYAAQALVEYAYEAYRYGWSARQLLGALGPDEFLQVGGMLPADVAGLPGPQAVTRELFARWVSLLFMAFAQLGVSRPSNGAGAGDGDEGWAWAGGTLAALQPGPDGGSSGDGDGSAMEAYSMASLVANTIEAKMRREQPDALQLSAAARAVAEQAAASPARLPTRWEGLSIPVVEDGGSLMGSSPSTDLIARQISLVEMACDVVQARARESAAARTTQP